MPNRTDGPNASFAGMVPTVEIKSKFDAEFRRFSVDRLHMLQFVEFYKLVCRLHKLEDCETSISYSDRDGELLPINNDSNLAHALTRAGAHGTLLRLVVQRKGDNTFNLHPTGRGVMPLINKFIPPKAQARTRVDIGEPVSFRPVSAIIDVDLVPATHLRVKLMKNGSDRPLGFYIRDGVSLRVTPSGVEKVPGIFISRLVPGGLAQHTGLLSVGDEVLEVNGIDVGDKTLDQVTDMMIANANNLIITVKPANQQLTLAAGRRNANSQKSKPNKASSASNTQLQTSSLVTQSSRGSSASDLQHKPGPDIPHGSPSHSASSSQSGPANYHSKAENNVVVVEEDSDSSDSDLEPDEVHIHDACEESPAKAPSNHNIDVAAVVEHHHQLDGATETTSSHESDEENASDNENYRQSPQDPASYDPAVSTTNNSENKVSKDSVLRI